MYEYETKIRVRYAETDQMGYVYYGNYATYYEVGRVEALRNLGMTYKELEEQGIMMPVVENHSKFLLPGRYDELLTIKVIIKEKPSIKIVFNYEIYNEADQLINIGETKLVLIDSKAGKPVRFPPVMKEILEKFFP